MTYAESCAQWIEQKRAGDWKTIVAIPPLRAHDILPNPRVPSVLCGKCGRLLLRGGDGYSCPPCDLVAVPIWRVFRRPGAEGYATPEEPLLSDTVDEDLGVA